MFMWSCKAPVNVLPDLVVLAALGSAKACAIRSVRHQPRSDQVACKRRFLGISHLLPPVPPSLEITKHANIHQPRRRILRHGSPCEKILGPLEASQVDRQAKRASEARLG